MYFNQWTVVGETTHNADVTLVPADSIAGLAIKEPVIIMHPGEPPKVAVPPRPTMRKTQKAYCDAAKLASSLDPKEVLVMAADLPPELLAAALWGVNQGLYQYREYSLKTVGPQVAIKTLQPLAPHLRQLAAIAVGQSQARDWVNLPANLKPPQKLAALMQELSSPRIEWEAYDQDRLHDMGAGGILGVGQGSRRPPVMLVGRYQGAPGDPWLALVGKGIIFDSGGISLKPGEGMGRMKGDMAGAAAVAAAIRVVAELGLQVNVLAVLPLAENLPGGGAYRPGDVLTMLDGTTVEVISTDAEGRLVLGDGIAWAVNQGVAAVVDIATLTGANVVALGGIRSALIGNDPELCELVTASAQAMAEPTWELPHDDDYAEFNKTTAADIKNSGGRPAGTITAGLFVGHFSGSVPWAHLDIAGMAFDASNGVGVGATGFGVATLVDLSRRFGQRSRRDAT